MYKRMIAYLRVGMQPCVCMSICLTLMYMCVLAWMHVWMYEEGVDRGGGGTGVEGAESGVEGAESGVEGTGIGGRGGGKRG